MPRKWLSGTFSSSLRHFRRCCHHSIICLRSLLRSPLGSYHIRRMSHAFVGPMISPENRKLFESMGTDAVRIDLLRGFEGNERIPRGPARQEALEWLTEEDGRRHRRETRRHWTIMLFTAIAAIAACIAAWPIVESWLSPPIPPQSPFTIVDPNGRTCQVYPDPKGRKPPRQSLAALKEQTEG